MGNLRLTFIRSLVAVGLVSCLSVGVFAAEDDDTDYNLGCTTTGPWTQRALENTAALRQVVNRLESWDECKGLAKFVSEAAEANKNIAAPVANDVASRMENIPVRESALLTFAGQGNQDFQFGVLQALLKEKFNLATANSFNIINNGFGAASGVVSKQSMSQAAALIDSVANSLPNYDKCLLNHAPDGAGLLTGLVSMAANLAGPTGGLNPQINNSVRNLITMFTTVAKFDGAKKILAEAEFWNSMACVIETTAETYCSVIDAKNMMDSSYLAQKAQLTADKKDIVIGDPLQGYETLILHVPNIAAWVQKVQFGIEPQWDTDSEFKVSAFENTANYITSAWNVLGIFNGMKQVYYRQKDLKSKRNYLLTMLQAAVGGVQKGAESIDFKTMSSDLNFYTLVEQKDKIPYILIGLPDIPKAAYRNEIGGLPLPWPEYMKGNGSFVLQPEKDPEGVTAKWANPDSLIVTVEAKLRQLITDASDKASNFYQDRIIVNKENLVAAALSDPGFTVYDSFVILNNYLHQVDALFSDRRITPMVQDQHTHLLGLVRDLETRVGTVVKAFDNLKTLDTVHPRTKKDKTFIEDTYGAVINTVYKQFDVLYQRDSYISSAVLQIVKGEYKYRILHNVGLGDYEKKLILASGRDFIDLLRTLHGFNPSKAQQDIFKAGTIAEQNLNGLELIFGDPLMRVIDQADMYIQAKGSGDPELWRRSTHRWINDTFHNGVAQRDNPISSFFGNLTGPIGRGWMQLSLRSNRYNFPWTMTRNIRPVGDPDHFWNYMKSELCILSLAFNNRADYRELCENAVLQSNYNSEPGFDLNASYKALLDAPYQDSADYKHNVICALRNYHRKNLVYRISTRVKLGLEAKGDILTYDEPGDSPTTPPAPNN